jgi:hypothetical protein
MTEVASEASGRGDLSTEQDKAPTSGPNGSAQSALQNLQSPGFRWCIDLVSEKEISGWIVAPGEPSRRLVVALRENGNVLARALASIFRGDLHEAGIGDGCHAFLLPLPSGLNDGG